MGKWRVRRVIDVVWCTFIFLSTVDCTCSTVACRDCRGRKNMKEKALLSYFALIVVT